MRKLSYALTIILLISFIVFTIIVKCVDVKPLGINETNIGLSTFNISVRDKIPYNETWYKITKYLGIIPFIICAFYGLQGIKELIKHKSLKKIDKRIIYLGVFYVVMLILYILADKIVINYRPILEDNSLESSFPSSHTLLACCVCSSSLLIAKYYIKNPKLLRIFNYLTILLMFLLVIGRLLSGVHWLTDIMGGIIYSAALVSLYYSFIYSYKKIRD